VIAGVAPELSATDPPSDLEMAEEVAALALSIINPKSERFIAAILPALRRGRSISPNSANGCIHRTSRLKS
jgi:hypothetical protein